MSEEIQKRRVYSFSENLVHGQRIFLMKNSSVGLKTLMADREQDMPLKEIFFFNGIST